LIDLIAGVPIASTRPVEDIMKLIAKTTLGLFIAGLGMSIFGQSGQPIKEDIKDAGKATGSAAKKTGKKVKRGTKKAVNKAAEKTEEGAAKVKDKTTP
jgi:hypothetical protein